MSIALPTAATSHADMSFGNYELIIRDRYDFHTWLWSTAARCGHDCMVVTAIPRPVAKAFPYRGNATLTNGQYTLAVEVPDGLRCGDVYYGPALPTRDLYTWDAGTLSGTLESSFDAGCDGAPGVLFYPFSLVRY